MTNFPYRRALIATAVVAAVAGCSSKVYQPISQGPDTSGPMIKAPKTWTLVWNDEFSGTAIDKSKWSHEENCYGGGNAERQCYTDRPVNSFVEDGKLHIVARDFQFTGSSDPQGKSRHKATLPYTSARLRTMNKGDWQYGRFEVRAKLPFGQGTWPAIWMLPTDYVYGGWAASGEIDIVEAVNLKSATDELGAEAGKEEARIHGTLHYGREWPDNVSTAAEYHLPDHVNPADGFHTYAIEWEKNEMRWYIDDIHYATQRSDGWFSQYKEGGKIVTGEEDAPFNQRFHMILNLAIGGSWASNANEGGIDDSIFPQTMEVDYVRVYECAKDPVNGKGCATVSEDAKFVAGTPAPEIIIPGPDYATGPEFLLYGDSLDKHLRSKEYDPQFKVYVETKQAEGRGDILAIKKTGDIGNFYFESPEVNMGEWMSGGEIVFDLLVEEKDPNANLMLKVDSGWPAASDVDVEIPPLGQWREVRINFADLINNGNRFAPGAKANVEGLKNIFVIEPTGPMVLYIDNIRYEK
ncbi:glycoside hydrolase family 16 protein [Enterovibrio norvegicus]|uniref:Beta-glucanase n=1 Tax=Enterovibrio norvegicus TaxID=188144 RepID=A0A2N7L7R6_9GAMM|nr:glycoside hydrolase family 16 protein [Enterovibrio norvegicus]PMN70045.1 beta-glucanase [Enterovibrio norvegicus]PMN90168.1 beta-glucanase [Enterovibrio norvegicus]